MSDERIIDLPTKTSTDNSDFIPVDSSNNGTNKISPSNFPISSATQAALDAKANSTALSAETTRAQGAESTITTNLNAHTSNTSNPHSVTKAQVGLGNVDNTADADKPVSTATQTALNAKANDNTVVHLAGTETISGAKTFSSDITNNANEVLTNTTFANQKGIIKKGSAPFIHDFSYGNNGTITPTGQNLFIGAGSGNFSLGSTATTTGQASFNLGVGQLTLSALTTGYSNTAIGLNTGLGINSGANNVALGGAALSSITSQNNNTAIGTYSLASGTAISSCTAIGYYSGNYNADGSTTNLTATNCTYLGAYTKSSASGNTNETVIGYNTTGNGSNTVTLGNDSIVNTYLKGVLNLKALSANEYPTLGSELLSSSNWTSTGWTGDFTNGFSHTTGNTTALSNSLAAVVNNYYQITYTVANRTAGSFALSFGGQTKASQTATGTFGPKATTTDNLVITPTSDFNGTIGLSVKQNSGGIQPSLKINDSTGAIALGFRTDLNSRSNIFIGLSVGSYNTTGSSNCGIGVNTLMTNTTGAWNTAFGNLALEYNTTGGSNTAVGLYSLTTNTIGNNNVSIGAQALQNATTASYNTAVGQGAMMAITTGGYNAIVGQGAMSDATTGVNNAGIGNSVLTGTLGNSNAAVGFAALANTGASNQCVGIGEYAGRYIADGSTYNNAVNKGVYLGWKAMASATGQTNEIVIGSSAIGKGSNTAVIGDTNVTDIYAGSNGGATVNAGKFKLSALNTAPASATATGTTGEIRIDANYIYVCVATNTWKRAALATW